MRIGLGIGIGMLQGGGVTFSGTVPECSPDVPAAEWGLSFTGTVPECSPDVPAATWHLWVASDEPDIVVWQRADLGVTLNGSRVAIWEDQIGDDGTKKDLARAAAGQQPLFNASDANFSGRSTMTFDPTRADQLESPRWTTPMPATCTWVAVYRVSGGWSGTRNRIIEGTSQAVTPGVRQIIQAYSGGFTEYAGSAVEGGTPALDTTYVQVNVMGASGKLYVNAETPVATGDTGANQMEGHAVGNTYAPDALNSLDGEVAEVFGLDVAASQATVERILRNLGAYYGVSIGA